MIFLYEIIEDYNSTDSKERKDEIFQRFTNSIWDSRFVRKKIKANIKYDVPIELANTPIGKILRNYEDIPYLKHQKHAVKKTWNCLIRQKINNLYSIYCDRSIILNDDYFHSISRPKYYYNMWIKGKLTLSPHELQEQLDKEMEAAKRIKKACAEEKLNINWTDYKILINGFLRKCFDHCILLEDYGSDELDVRYSDNRTDDNFYISYICASLDGYVKNYQKDYYGIKRKKNQKFLRCKQCHCLFERKSKTKPEEYCPECRRERILKSKSKYAKKRRSRKD